MTPKLYPLLIAGVLALIATDAMAQSKPYQPSAKAMQLEDSAGRLFMAWARNADSIKKVGMLLDEVIRTDPKYYEGWTSKMSFQGRMGDLQNAQITAKKITVLFPDHADAFQNYGALQYVNGQEKDAMVSFNRQLALYDAALEKVKSDSTLNSRVMMQKGITLLLLNRGSEGKRILKRIYDSTDDETTQSFISFYFNHTRDEIIRDRIPGQ